MSSTASQARQGPVVTRRRLAEALRMTSRTCVAVRALVELGEEPGERRTGVVLRDGRRRVVVDPGVAR